MSDETVQIGLLMEAAQAHQTLAESALQKLRIHLQGLDSVVRDEIRRTLISELQALTSATQRATEALRSAKRAANLRVTLWSVGIVALSSVIPVAIGQWALPSKTEISVLRSKRDELSANVA